MDESHASVGCYVVDALEELPAEFESHLANCSLCAREVEEFFETLAELSRTTSMAPPPALRQRTLASIHSLNVQLPGGFTGTTMRPGPGAFAGAPMAWGLLLLALVVMLVWLLG